MAPPYVSERETPVVKPTNARYPGLEEHLATLRADFSHDALADHLDNKLAAGHAIRQSLLDHADVRDVFRQSQGFEVLLQTLDSLAGFPSHDNNRAPESPRAWLHLLRLVFSILAAALADHRGNQWYFQDRISSGGWESIHSKLHDLRRSAMREIQMTQIPLDSAILGCLFACAVDDETVVDLFKLRQLPQNGRRPVSARRDSSSTGPSNKPIRDAQDVANGTDVEKMLGNGVRLQHPEALCVAFRLWLEWQYDNDDFDKSDNASLLVALLYIAESSIHNLVALRKTRLLSILIQPLLDTRLMNTHVTGLHKLANRLLGLGVSTLDDAYMLYSNAHTSASNAKLLLDTLRSSRSPSYFYFDLGICGYSSIELPDLGTKFPPSGSSNGYTLALWLRVWKFDNKTHTTLFGAFDSSQSCFILVYLEKDSHNLILQTSVTSSRPSVRFKSVFFQEKRWYHIAIAHRRPKTTSSSRVSLYVDGKFAEQVKANYPLSSPISQSKTDSPSHNVLTSKINPVQAFVGTPQDLASRLGKDLVSSQWQLASTYIFGDVLSDDLLAVYFELGPRYFGNYQDCLGSFNTYQAAASLKLRNDGIHTSQSQRSDIITAMESGASGLLAEEKIILALSPSNVLTLDHLGTPDEAKYLSKRACGNVKTLCHKGHKYIVLNGATPAVNDSLGRPSGYAVLTGEPAIAMVQSLDDASWQVGGCTAVILEQLDKSNDDDSVLRALSCVFESLRDNWRCSEAMEKENGFAILAQLMAKKLSARTEEGKGYTPLATRREDPGSDVEDNFPLKILTSILEFLGFDNEKPKNSILNNPLAYRVLLVDVDLWRSMAPPVQDLYYRQFTVFGLKSHHHVFNAKRLSKMRIVKKWLDALKVESFRSTTFDNFLDAFGSILTVNMTADNLRSLALHITYAIEKVTDEERRSHGQVRESTPSPEIPTAADPDFLTRNTTLGDHAATELSTSQVSVRLLRLFTDLICRPGDSTIVTKFTKTVTNKWLLNLLVSHHDQVVVEAVKILARLLVVNGPAYLKRFSEENQGISIMQFRLKHWWHLTPVWRSCFAILLGYDVASVDYDKPFTLPNLLDDFVARRQSTEMHPAIFPVLTSMMQGCLKSIREDGSNTLKLPENRGKSAGPKDVSRSTELLLTVIRFFADMHQRSSRFRDFAVTSKYVKELLFTLYPIVINLAAADPDAELHLRELPASSGKNDVLVRPLLNSSAANVYSVRTSTADVESKASKSRLPTLRRMSSYVLVKSDWRLTQSEASDTQLTPFQEGQPRSKDTSGSSLTEELLENIIMIYMDQILVRKDFPGLGLFMKVPPGAQEHQAYFESFVLRSTLTQLANTIRLDQKALWEPKVLANLQRLASHLSEAVFEGWFIDGAEAVIEFLGQILEYVQQPDVYRLKSIRLCDHIIASIREVLMRIIILRVSEFHEGAKTNDVVFFMEKLVYWLTSPPAAEERPKHFLRLCCFLLYSQFKASELSVRNSAVDLWRVLLAQRPEDASRVLKFAVASQNEELFKGLGSVSECDNENFLAWIDTNRNDLESVYFGPLYQSWKDFVTEENNITEAAALSRISKRKQKLRQWSLEAREKDEIIHRHEISCGHWRSNIHASESMKRQRAIQDHQNNVTFVHTSWERLRSKLERPCGLLEGHEGLHWQLDRTEGRNRMRLRMTLDQNNPSIGYRPKRSESQGPNQRRRTLVSRRKTVSKAKSPIPTQAAALSPLPKKEGSREIEPSVESEEVNGEDGDGFEIIADPRSEMEDFEDKNRKVMRSLHRNDQVEHVHNVSRIVGLEGSEGLLILGKHYLYLLDGLFQRSDGEIVNVSQAPRDERDAYLQMISGHEAQDQNMVIKRVGQEVRSWRRDEVLSISKRRFLFRDVAIEVFFRDGRSYLLTTNEQQYRDELYQRLLSKVSAASGRTNAATEEASWRFDAIDAVPDQPLSLGSRFTSVFAQNNVSPMTRRWVQGEVSNFNYLMHINTLAGRTFNDLTQYPVFPWIIADYTSQKLDLTDPRSFRDLTKPMGCQTPERQAEFRDRYQSFAEMGDHNAPPFHYGTHYSTAMIVTSYLIRLQPFVQSYLLLQGGFFDHPDRLFYSIEKAWLSASRGNMTDVRELIPEFFYLPEFLLNANGFDFGERQGDGGPIDKVALPPWANGDPMIFIMKNREALESEYVSKHLHHWIDLVFGHKQRGEAALEATNVFHHLSYHGAKDLDKIEDPVERLATIGIIHNFGQTPHQVFQRSHPPRDNNNRKTKQIDSMVENLTRLPSAVFEIDDRVTSLQYSAKTDRLLCAAPSKVNIGPTYDKYMQWGFVDGSVRFYTSDTKKLLGLFEHVHVSQLSSVTFVESQTLVTAGNDCVVSVWGVNYTSSTVELQPKGSLFGHRTAVNILATSQSFRTILSASTDGEVLLWDLNRLEILRKLTSGSPLSCARIHDVNGTIMICRGAHLTLYTLNGELILEQNVCTEDDVIVSCAFYEGSGSDFLERNLVFTGHRRGVVNIWNMTTRGGLFVLEHVKRMHHLDQMGFNIGASVTCVLPLAQKVYTGDEDGRV
ncbi:MAG: hypothetical protein Q9222_005516, partial [Ikaeria aurantiellina]